jgi:hypothetical protein
MPKQSGEKKNKKEDSKGIIKKRKNQDLETDSKRVEKASKVIESREKRKKKEEDMVVDVCLIPCYPID